jgi:protein-tyrosine phosphatase
MKDIKLRGADNARDFAGTETRDGRVIRDRMFIRSNHLGNLTCEDIGKLKDEYHLSKVIDLRTDVEAAEHPDVKIAGVTYLLLPLFASAAVGLTHEKGTGIRSNKDMKIPDMADLYRFVVTDPYSVSQLKTVFSEIIAGMSGWSENPGVTLWHCTEGKDRCGIVSALFLTLLGVDEAAIMDDYLLTNRVSVKRARKYFWKVLLFLFSLKKARLVRKILMADTGYLNAALDAIKETYGSADTFLHDVLGVDDSARERLKSVALTN